MVSYLQKSYHNQEFLFILAIFHTPKALILCKNAPPPPPVQVQEEKPQLAEPDVSPEPSKLPEGGTAPEEKPEPKELAQEIPTPKTQADLGVGANSNSNLGSDDLERLKK